MEGEFAVKEPCEVWGGLFEEAEVGDWNGEGFRACCMVLDEPGDGIRTELPPYGLLALLIGFWGLEFIEF